MRPQSPYPNLLLLFSLLLTTPTSAFKIAFGYASSTGSFKLLEPPTTLPPTDENCHEITNTLAPPNSSENVDFIRVQSQPSEGEPAGIIAFYKTLEECISSNPMYIPHFKQNYRGIQAATPYWTIMHLGELKGGWNLGRTGYPAPRAWKNIPKRGVSPEIGIVRRVGLKQGDVAMLFDEGWAVDVGGVAREAGGLEKQTAEMQELKSVNGFPQKTPSSYRKEEDGTEVFLYPDGSGKAVVPDGSVIETRPDGTSVAHQDGPDGFIAEFNPQTGALIQDNEGTTLRLNPTDVAVLEALDEAGAFESPTALREIMSGRHSSLFSPNAAGAYEALARLHANGDFVADFATRTEQDDSPPRNADSDAVALPDLKVKGKNIFQKIGSAAKRAYDWARGSCKLRGRQSSRSPVLPECAADIDLMRENEFSPFSLGSPSASASYLGEGLGNGQRLSRFHQGRTVETPNGDEQSFKHTFSPVPDATDGDFTEENLESPYFAKIDMHGNEFTFRDEENSRGSEDVADQGPDEIIQLPGQFQDYSLGILNVLNRKKDTSEFTFKPEQGMGTQTQTMGDVYTEGAVPSYPELDDVEEDVVVQDISKASSSNS
ncbi:hypothetical protein TWF506_005766 [Arthrobotrys conoides]|uniref:Uncharacterized protein n=1 Tax=Arthrobotrys conoides TaxID=74498 RepID=A0AAN8NKB4_9PEZI